jgi:mono/diheme cytochrome c family protein/glucose/arabinose dehydrogenase
MYYRSSVAFLLLALAAPLALAQRGDKQGEVQPPVPAHIKIPPAPVLTPEQELATFKLAPGFHAELVAGDPLVGDPVAMQFGPDGRLWVVEMRGYMLDVDGHGEDQAVGVIAVLSDTDGDGRYDRRVVFADKLVMPRALALVGDGALVGYPAKLVWMRDTNGDGQADVKTEVVSDYGVGGNPEHDANGLMWALDNWLYNAKHNVRFRWLGDGKLTREKTIPRGQWGITQDDVGRIYYDTNSDPLRVDVVPSAYLNRNSNFPGAGGTNVSVVSSRLRIWPGRVTPGVNRAYNSLDGEGKITAMTGAAGPVIYRGALLGPDFVGNGFVPEVAGNLVKRIKISDQDGVPTGANAYEGTEFMTSTDERFRPVNVFNGPDGALYVVDMYRGVIQHRTFVTSFLRKQIEERSLEKGVNLGRIWRIVPDGAPKANYQLTLATASPVELTAKLSDPNGWVRDTAQQLLVEKRDPAANVALRRLAVDAAQPPLARVHALWTLEGTDGLDRGTIAAALADKDPRVCAAAVRLAEKFLAPPTRDAELTAQVAALVATRAEPAVRLQLALSLGEAGTPAADLALRQLAIAAGAQRFVADAIVSGLAGREEDLIEGLVKNAEAAARTADTIRFATSAVLKSGNAARIERVLVLTAAADTPDWARTALFAGVRNFLPRTPDGRTMAASLPAEPKPLLALAAKKGSLVGTAAEQLLTQLKWPGKPGAETVAARPLTRPEQVQFDRGQLQFAQLCAACHQPNGQGLAGLAPSLLFSRWVLGDPRIVSRIVLNGKMTENRVMPPWKTMLTDQAVADVLTFVRRSWGHEADPVTVATVTEARAELREQPLGDAELEAMVKIFGLPTK